MPDINITITPDDGLQDALQKLAEATQAASDKYGANITIMHGDYRNLTEAFVDDRHTTTGRYFVKAYAVAEGREE